MVLHDESKQSRLVSADNDVGQNGTLGAQHDVQTATEYWEGVFRHSGPQPCLHSFPLEYEWPRSDTTVHVANGLLNAALGFCKKYEIGLHDLLYGVWAVVAARHSSTGESQAGFVVAAQKGSLLQHAEVNLSDRQIPLVLAVPETLDVVSWIRQVEVARKRSFTHAHIGYDRILRTAPGAQLQVKVKINSQPDDGHEPITVDAPFPLVLNICVSSNLELRMRHNSFIPKSDVRVLLGHFTASLSSALESARLPLSRLQMMADGEDRLLRQYGEAEMLSNKGLIHHLIEQQAKLTPDLDAVQFEMDSPLSFSELNKRSNRLARRLRSHGSSFVPVHMRPSVNFIVALLAILKAGAAYVVLDPSSSPARRSYIITDVGATYVLVDEATSGDFHAEYKVEDLLSQSEDYEESDFHTGQVPTDVAYIIYTSGSSGNPKAAVLEHEAAFNGLVAYPKSAGLRQLLFYNPVFSAAQRSIWATLAVGGCLCLASKENLTVHLAQTINTMNVNSIDMTSSTAALISPEQVPSLRRLTLGGEMATPGVILKWSHRVELFSSYGLSECTQLNWRSRLLSQANPRMIGQPFDTTTSFILFSESTDICPLLIPGELCLGGHQLARGYLGLEEETKRRFIPNPFGSGRLYRTGDMAVRHADGCVEILGRIDFQVKINGQRVDPGEPNSVIQSHTLVEHSAVVPTLVNKKMLLVAVIVVCDGAEWGPLVEMLRNTLAARVPLYMLPSFWVSVSALPTNANGKTDMTDLQSIVKEMNDSGRLLPDIEKNEVDASSLTQTEFVIRSLWAEVLNLPEPQISPEDSFVSLGGTSLEAIQFVSRLRSEHALDLRVEDVIFGNSLTSISCLVVKIPDAVHDQDHTAPFSLLREPLDLSELGFEMSEVEDAFPVTPFQEATIADSIMGGKAYIYSRTYSFAGHDRNALKEALFSLTRTNSLLRTTFRTWGPSFIQVVKKAADVPLETSDMDVKEYLQGKASELRDASGPWWKATVLPGNILVLTTHHALFDYWSNEFFSHDLSALLTGKSPTHRPAFRRYVAYLEQHDDFTMRQFWKDYLDGARTLSLGPFTGPELSVMAPLQFDVRNAASKLKVTPSVLLYAAWSVVLATVGCTEDVVFGITLSGRDASVPGVIHINGPTLMIAPLRLEVLSTVSFESHLKSVQSSLWEVAKHAQYGLRRILKAGRQSKDLVGSMVNFLIKLPVLGHVGGLVPRAEMNLGTVDNVKLELNNDSMDHVSMVSALDRTLAQSLVDSVAQVLKSSVSTPYMRLGDLLSQPSFTEVFNPSSEGISEGPIVEAHAELQGIPKTAEALPFGFKTTANRSSDRFEKAPADLPLERYRELAHAAFFRAAASYPGRIAVEDASGARITYAGLAIKVNQLASLLRAKGVELEQIIPIMFEKSINTVIAEFGIMAAGAAFLPLGPENPQQRNRGILDDLKGKIAVADRNNAGFFADTGYEVIVLEDIIWDSIPIQRQDVPGLAPDCLAYVIYTSGSTGKPKGTLLVHEGVVAATEAINEATNTDLSHKFLWVPNYTFDGSLDTLFTALSVGCTLCVAPQSSIASNLTGLINFFGANRVNMPPAMTTLIDPAEVPTLKVLITGGEPLTTQVLAAWAPRVEIYNAYGPTEATISVTTTPVNLESNLRNVGPPFKHVTGLILDPDTMEAMPEGAVGELCLSGPQLAKGYLNRPDATEKAFRNGTFGRIYRTGDLARLLPDGGIELLGRKDDQVKINGYRIELGEIESVVRQASIFEHCVVIAATVFKKKQLVGFYVRGSDTPMEGESRTDFFLAPGEIPDNEEIKGQLTTVPTYMVPTLWLPVSKFPFSVAGKIDRKRLQALVEEMDELILKDYLPREDAVEISSEAELTLQSLWSVLFQVPLSEIHANSSFHALGGDSITALNLVSMLRRHGFEIKVSEILSKNILKQQAKLIDNEVIPRATFSTQKMHYQPPEAVYNHLSQIGIQQDDIEDIYPCSPGQIEFLTQGNKQDQFWQLMSVRKLPRDFDFDRWVQLTTTLTQNNQILRALYCYTDREHPSSAVQIILKQPPLNLTHRSFESEEEMRQILDAEWEARFDPAKPFVRYTCITERNHGRRYLVIKLDHASYDGTLLHIFDDQFKALNNGVPILEHTPFRDFVSHVVSMPKQPQLDFWVRLLEGKNFDFLSNISITPKISRLRTAQISADVGIDDVASMYGVTVPIVFQTAYSMLLAHLSGSEDVVYDNLITGRNVAMDNPQLINGNCANFLPFHSNIAPSTPLNLLLQQTQSDFWTATEHGFVSLGEIYNALGRDRDLHGARCLFCFQPFEPSAPKEQEDHMRWIVMKMSKNTMFFNYAIQLEVVKGQGKGKYAVRFGYDERAISEEDAERALDWYVGCLEAMEHGGFVADLGI